MCLWSETICGFLYPTSPNLSSDHHFMIVRSILVVKTVCGFLYLTSSNLNQDYYLTQRLEQGAFDDRKWLMKIKPLTAWVIRVLKSPQKCGAVWDLLFNTLFCLQIPLQSVVWICNTLGYLLGIKHELAKYLKESCCLGSDLNFSIKWFLEYAFL